MRYLTTRKTQANTVADRAGAAAALVAVLGLATSGCGGTYKYDAVVTGTVTVDGELATSGTLIFHPVDGGPAAIGRVYPDGSYSLRTGQGDLKESDGGTVKSGEYVVTAVITGPPAENAVVGQGGPPIAGPLLIAKKYTRVETSDLRRTVKSGANIFVFDLERAEPGAEAEPAPDEEAVPEAAADADAESTGSASPQAGDEGATRAESSADGDEDKPEESTP